MKRLYRLLKRNPTQWDEVLWWFQDVFYYSWYKPLCKYKEMMERMIFWAWNMRWSWDFDAHTVYEMLYLKFDKLHNSMLQYGNLVWDSSPDINLMRKLCECKHLAKRLSEFDYQTQGFIETEKRFGHKSWFESIEGSTNSLWKSKWINKEKEAKLYYKVRNKHYQKMREADKKRLYYLMDKYLDYFWD